jgi:translation initiation factor 2 gamma subunit (eIF-2gamma)
MRIMRGIKDFKMRFKIRKKGEEIRRGKGRGTRGGVLRVFYKVKIATDKGINITRDMKKGGEERFIKREIIGFEINVKDLERKVRGGMGGVPTGLDIALTRGGKGNI